MQVNNTLRIIGCFALGIFLVLVLTCSYDTTVAGGSTETTNSKILGIVYNPQGSPAIQAMVKIADVAYNPGPSREREILTIDSVRTDKNGIFRIDSLPSGFYTFFIEGDSGYAYQDSIFISSDATVQEISDTLQAPGSIRGMVKLQQGHNPQSIFIIVFGTPLWTMPDDTLGNFILLNMAEGRYRVRFLTTIDDYNPLDTVLTITSGVNTVLYDTLYLPFIGIPTPTGLSCTYDTVSRTVTLKWNQADTTLVKRFAVYRRHSDSDYVKIAVTDGKQTSFIDFLSGGPPFDGTYHYTISALDKSGNEGKKCAEKMVSVIGKCKGWSVKSSIEPVRELLSGVIDSVLYCFCGVNANGASDRVLKYDADNDVWSVCAPIPEPRMGASGCAWKNKYYYFSGEASTWMLSNYEYNTLKNEWKIKSNECLMGKEVSVACLNNVLIAVGGIFWACGISDSVSQYDPVTDRWTARSSMNKARTKLCVCNINNTLYAIGGDDGSTVLNIIEEYNPTTDIWTVKTSIPVAVSASACCAYNGKIYVFGGFDGQNVMNSVVMYDPELNTWVEKSPMPTARMDLTAATVSGKIYVIGGFNGHSIVGAVEEYDPRLDP